MSWITNLYKKITNWFDSLLRKSREEYQLDKYFIPEYNQIKQAHQLLLKEYVRAITATSRLSFFIGLNEIKLPQEGLARRIFTLLLGKYSPIRFLALKPLVSLFVEIHISKKLLDLSIAYTQTIFLIQNSLAENLEYLSWLKQAKQECDEFRQTLPTGKLLLDTIKGFGTFVLGLILTIVGANSLSDFFLKLLENDLTQTGLKVFIFSTTTLLLGIPYIYLFLDSTFATKRLIFLGVGSEISEKHNVYVFENELYKLLGRGKSKEFPIDYSFQGVFQIGFILFFFYLQKEFEKIAAGPNVIVLPCFSCIGLIFIVFLIFDVIIPWQRRASQKYM
ncbi:MAG: hypothetical protein JNK81_07615 [Anaerolineales bacterium]|nr:hypothetical protein [Anaerolineales bacterium]